MGHGILIDASFRWGYGQILSTKWDEALLLQITQITKIMKRDKKATTLFDLKAKGHGYCVVGPRRPLEAINWCRLKTPTRTTLCTKAWAAILRNLSTGRSLSRSLADCLCLTALGAGARKQGHPHIPAHSDPSPPPPGACSPEEALWADLPECLWALHSARPLADVP